jgi:hypothetical protein
MRALSARRSSPRPGKLSPSLPRSIRAQGQHFREARIEQQRPGNTFRQHDPHSLYGRRPGGQLRPSGDTDGNPHRRAGCRPRLRGPRSTRRDSRRPQDVPPARLTLPRAPGVPVDQRRGDHDRPARPGRCDLGRDGDRWAVARRPYNRDDFTVFDFDVYAMAAFTEDGAARRGPRAAPFHVRERAPDAHRGAQPHRLRVAGRGHPEGARRAVRRGGRQNHPSRGRRRAGAHPAALCVWGGESRGPMGSTASARPGLRSATTRRRTR